MVQSIILSFYKELSKNPTNPGEIVHTEKFTYKNKTVTMHGLINSGDLRGIYINEEYKFLKVEGKTVVDIGTNIGDSAIYFILNGAKNVIGLEPYPYSFNLAISNIRDNNMTGVIELLNAGYGHQSEIYVNENQMDTTGLALRPSNTGKLIKTLSLKNIIEKYNLNNFVLKMDCEGYEYALIDEEDQLFNNIQMIQIEYHYGYETLLTKLKKCGFNVKFTAPRKSYNPKAENPHMESGYIYAERLQ